MQVHRVGAEQFRRELTELLNRTSYGGDRVIVERHGTPLAVLIPYTLYEALLSQADLTTEHPAMLITAALATQIETAREQAEVSYEEMAVALQAQRLRTLRESYPEFLPSPPAEQTVDNATHEPA